MAEARAIVTLAAMFLAFASVVLVLWLGAQDVVARRMSGGALMQFVLYAVFGAGALGQLSEVWNEVSQAAGAAARIGELLAVEPRIAAPRRPRLCRARARRARLRSVDFAYPGRDEGVLRDVSFRVAPGEAVASSVRPAQGNRRCFSWRCVSTIRRAAQSPSTASTSASSIRRPCARSIALVPQEPVIFGASVADNIAYGAPGATPMRSRRRQAGRRARIHRRPAAGL